MKQIRLYGILIVVLMFLSVGMVLAQDATVEPTLPESTSDIPLYAVPGPYSVGRTWFSVSNGAESPLILVAWYPALEGDQEGTLAVPDEYNFPDVEVMENAGNWGGCHTGCPA